VRVKRGDFQRLPFGDGCFDHLYCIEALCYTTDLRAALAEQVRVLRPGGRITLFDAYRTRPPAGYAPHEAMAVALIEKAMALEQFTHLDHLLTVAGDLGLKVVHREDLYESVMPNLRRFEKKFGLLFRFPLVAKWLLSTQAPLKAKNAVAGLLMAPSADLRLHCYCHLTFEKPAGN